MAVGVFVGVFVGVRDGVSVNVGVRDGVSVAVCVAVGGTGVLVEVDVAVGVSVGATRLRLHACKGMASMASMRVSSKGLVILLIIVVMDPFTVLCFEACRFSCLFFFLKLEISCLPPTYFSFP